MPISRQPIRAGKPAALTVALLAGAPAIALASDYGGLSYLGLYAVAVPVFCLAVILSATAWRQPGWISAAWGLALALLLTPWYVKDFSDALILVPPVAVVCGLAIHGLLRYFLERRPRRYDASRSPLAQAQRAAAEEQPGPPQN
ncbi:hypothetical protein [Tahibacter harae]|uniref:Uncharacterized protein n=1 Tax=Tahibacter harae TaxID=2963937 RepID=A0ABT1QNX1_9GAMM|nr:hypothetical protein [Tahibacter harae]MCQ4163425.1 hypothetical protein [Tahibacter harae]